VCVCVCVYIYIDVYIYRYIYGYIYRYIYRERYIYIYVFIHICIYVCIYMQCTGRRRPIVCLIFICQIPQKSPIISGSFTENDQQIRHSMGLGHPVGCLLSLPCQKGCVLSFAKDPYTEKALLPKSHTQDRALLRERPMNLARPLIVARPYHAQCVVACCSVLQCVAVCFSVLQLL